MSKKELISNAFQVFSDEAPGHAAAWQGLVQSLAAANTLDQKNLCTGLPCSLGCSRNGEWHPISCEFCKAIWGDPGGSDQCGFNWPAGCRAWCHAGSAHRGYCL